MKRKTKDLIRASIRQRSKLTDEVGEHPRKAKRKKKRREKLNWEETGTTNTPRKLDTIRTFSKFVLILPREYTYTHILSFVIVC